MAVSDTKGRRGKKLDGKTSKAVLKKVKVDIPDLGMGCPDQAEAGFSSITWRRVSAKLFSV